MAGALQSALRGRPGQVSVVVTTRQKVRAVNRMFLGRDRETDVIAFDLADPCEREAGRIVGEIVVSGDRAVSESRRRGHSAEAELALYVVHGGLHLMGMDDCDAEKRAAMHKAALRILRRHGYRLSDGSRSSGEG